MSTKVFVIFIALAFGSSKGLCAFKNRTYQKALLDKYKNCELKKENIFLSKEKLSLIEKKLNSKISSLLLRYTNPCKKSYIYVDSHIVRTLNETVIIEVKNNIVDHLEIASFMEPTDYLPPQKWLDLFKTQKFKKTQTVDGLTGATLSENAIKKLVGKYIVIDNVLNDKI